MEDWTKAENKDFYLLSLRRFRRTLSLMGKQTNELKVPEKNVRTVIKQGLSPEINPLIILYEAF